MDYPTFYQIALDSVASQNTIDEYNGIYSFDIKPDPRAPIIDSTWRGGVHFAYLKDVENQENYSLVGLVSSSFSGGEHNPQDSVVLCTEECKDVAASYTVINDHAFFNLKNDHLFRNGGKLEIGLVHIDRGVDDKQFIPLTHESFLCILRFEKIRGFDKCKCHHK